MISDRDALANKAQQLLQRDEVDDEEIEEEIPDEDDDDDELEVEIKDEDTDSEQDDEEEEEIADTDNEDSENESLKKSMFCCFPSRGIYFSFQFKPFKCRVLTL